MKNPLNDMKFEDLRKRKVSERKALQMYVEYLDELYGIVKICGYSYDASFALEKVDEVAFRVGFADWISELEDIEIEEED